MPNNSTNGASARSAAGALNDSGAKATLKEEAVVGRSQCWWVSVMFPPRSAIAVTAANDAGTQVANQRDDDGAFGHQHSTKIYGEAPGGVFL